MDRQRSKAGATLGWQLETMIPANATPVAIGGKLVFWDGPSRKLFFAEACIVNEIHVMPQPTPPEPPEPPTP